MNKEKLMGKICETCGMTRWENRQVTGWVDETRDELERFRRALRVIAEGEYASEAHAASYARRALDRSVVLPSLGPTRGDE